MRIKLSRDFYIPKDAQEIRASDCNAVAYLAQGTYRNGTPHWHAVAFSGKRNKPDWNYTFKSEQQARQYIAEHEAGVKAREKLMSERAQARYNVRAADHFKVGDMLHTSWGYDQTNVEFFKVVRVLDKSIEVVAIGGKEVPGSAGFMSCALTPDPDNVLVGEWECRYNGIKRVIGSPDGSVHVPIHDHSSGYKIAKGAQTYCSWYA